MFKKILAIVAAVTVVAGLSACSSVQTGSNLMGDQKLVLNDNVQTKGIINSDIWGIYLFDVPLFTGSSKNPNRCAFFTDTVNVNSAIALTTSQSKAIFDSSAVVDVTSARTSTWIFPLLIFWYKDVQVSGTAVR